MAFEEYPKQMQEFTKENIIGHGCGGKNGEQVTELGEMDEDETCKGLM